MSLTSAMCSKLKMVGITGDLLEWIKDFLHNRLMRVIENCSFWGYQRLLVCSLIPTAVDVCQKDIPELGVTGE